MCQNNFGLEAAEAAATLTSAVAADPETHSAPRSVRI